MILGIRKQIPILCAERNLGEQERDDIQKFIMNLLNKSTLDPIVNILEEKASGLFIYARMLEEHFESMNEINFEKLTTLPGSMGDMYMKNFERIFPTDESYVEVKEFISMIVVAQEPLDVSFLSSAMKIDTGIHSFIYLVKYN